MFEVLMVSFLYRLDHSDLEILSTYIKRLDYMVVITQDHTMIFVLYDLEVL